LAEIGVPSRSLAFSPACKVAVASFIAAANAAESSLAHEGGQGSAAETDRREAEYQSKHLVRHLWLLRFSCFTSMV